MTRFTDRVTRDLHQIADRSTPSSTAWDSIRTRIDEQADQPPTMEVIMLSPDRNDQPKRGWMLAAAAVAGLALVGGLVFATTGSDDDTVPANTPTATLPTEPAPDAEVDPDAEAVVVPAPDPTTAGRGGAGTRTGSRAGDGHGDRHLRRIRCSASATPTPSSVRTHGRHDVARHHHVRGTVRRERLRGGQVWHLPDGSRSSTPRASLHRHDRRARRRDL